MSALTAIKLALRMAMQEGALAADEIQEFASKLNEAAMALEISADEMRLGSPIVARRHAKLLDSLGNAMEDVALAHAHRREKPIDPTKLYKVGELDMEGLQGRQHHPELSDKGKTVRLLRVHEVVHGGEAVGDRFWIWLCLLDGKEPRLLELADYELEEV